MEKTYIEAEIAEKKLKELLIDCPKTSIAYDWVLRAYQIIFMIEPADVVEVIRCKDCKHKTNFGYCTAKKVFEVNRFVRPQDFCSRGEPKK